MKFERRNAINISNDTSIPLQSHKNSSVVSSNNPYDIEQYKHHFEGIEISDEDAAELIHTLIVVMKAFVDCGFSLDPVQICLEEANKQLSKGFADTLDSENIQQL